MSKSGTGFGDVEVIFRMDEVTGEQVPVNKLMLGDDGVNGGYVSSTNPLPVAGTVNLGVAAMTALNAVRDATDGMAFSVLTDEQLRATPVNVESATLNEINAQVTETAIDIELIASLISKNTFTLNGQRVDAVLSGTQNLGTIAALTILNAANNVALGRFSTDGQSIMLSQLSAAAFIDRLV